MSIVITNVSRNGAKRCRYQLKINAKVIAEFKHTRADGLGACLRMAAEAADRAADEDLVSRLFRLAVDPQGQ